MRRRHCARSHRLPAAMDPKIWQKRTQKLWSTAGWESRIVGWVTGVDARATGTRRPRGDDALASIPSHAHLGGCPVFLEQLSSTDDCSCPRRSRARRTYRQRPCWTRLSHTDVCIAQSVCISSHRQRSSAVYNGCREAGTTARASGGLRAALIAPLFVLVLVLQRFYKPWFIYGVQFAPRVQTMVL